MSQVYWGFPISNEVYCHTRAILTETIAGEGGTKRSNKALADVVHQLVEQGLDAYYHAPTNLVTMTPAMRATVDGGVKIITGALKIVIKQFFSSLDQPKLHAVSMYIEDLLWRRESVEQVSLVFTLDRELHERLSETLRKSHRGDLSRPEVAELIAHLRDIVDICILHYFQKPTELVELSGLGRSVSDLGIRNVRKGFHSFLERLLSRLDREELARLSEHLETLLHQPNPVATLP